jgi:hypothetical protein
MVSSHPSSLTFGVGEFSELGSKGALREMIS